MSDKAGAIETLGVEQVPENLRHGTPGRMFTLWFGANLTIADYVIGSLTIQVFQLTFLQAIPVILVGNLLGGLVLGLSAGMGPRLGFPQMLSSRGSFGRRGNYIFGGLNWISTIGWFAVNTILGVEAIQAALPWVNFYAFAILLVAVQILIAVFGHDFIHLFEKAMSVILGLLFLGATALMLSRWNQAVAFVPSGGSPGFPAIGAVGVVLAVTFSYLMSWSPYASDYSRYLSTRTSTRSVALFALAGGALASSAVEVVGALVGSLTPGQGYFVALYGVVGWFGPLAILAVLLGALAANALNIYTNALSSLVLDIKARRWVMVVIGGMVGLAVSLIGQANFEVNYENFLLVLDYWITPWLGIVLVDFYLSHRTTVDRVSNPRSIDPVALGIYAVSVAISVPFMVPALPLGLPFGALSGYFGGADFSYFISFGLAAVLTLLLRKGKGH